MDAGNAISLATLGAFIAIQAPARTELTATVSILAIAAIIVSADGLRLSSPPWRACDRDDGGARVVLATAPPVRLLAPHSPAAA